MIQSADYSVNCRVEGLNEWSNLGNPTDVSESNSFLWIGKTQHVIRHLKTNVRPTILFDSLFRKSSM